MVADTYLSIYKVLFVFLSWLQIFFTPSCLFQVNANELTNGVINAAFMLLFKDAIRLFAAYNEGIINLLGKNKSHFCHYL